MLFQSVSQPFYCGVSTLAVWRCGTNDRVTTLCESLTIFQFLSTCGTTVIETSTCVRWNLLDSFLMFERESCMYAHVDVSTEFDMTSGCKKGN